MQDTRRFYSFRLLFAWGVVAIVGVASLLFLDSGINSKIAILALPAIVIALIVWAGLLIRNMLAWRRGRRETVPWVALGIALLLAIGALVLDAGELPMKVAIAYSRPAMDALAREVLALPPNGTMPGPLQVGAFHGAEIHRFPGGMAFRTEEGNWLDWNGYAYVEGTSPPVLEGYYFGPSIGGHWYGLSIGTSPYPNNAEPYYGDDVRVVPLAPSRP